MCNSRTIRKEADFLLKKLNLKLSFTWSYEPFGMISKLRVEYKTTPYTHTRQLEIDKYMDRDQLEENTLKEKEG